MVGGVNHELLPFMVDEVVRRALAEDLAGGDLTTEACIDHEARAIGFESSDLRPDRVPIDGHGNHLTGHRDGEHLVRRPGWRLRC